MLLRFIFALCIALITACASQPDTASKAVPQAAQDAAATTEPVFSERPFPEESLHSLLVAEFALRRREYNVALDQYVEQAPALRDAGISAHTTRLAQFLDRREEALEAALLWVELEPDNLEARTAAARQYVMLGRSSEALPHLEAIARAGGSANFAVVTSNYSSLSPQEQQALMGEIETLAEQFPSNSSLLLTQALLYADQDRPDDALSSLDAVLTLAPTQTQALLLEASLLRDRGDDNPYRRIKHVLRDNPEDQTLRLRYARMLTSTDMQAAREQFEILSAQAPDDADLLFSLALINREIGEPVTAAAYLRQMIELDERTDEAYYYLGRLAQERGQYEEAIGHYQSVTAGEELMAANSRIGEILLETGQTVRFLAWFEESRQMHPEQSAALYGLQAELLGNAGENELAETLLNRGLAVAPDDSTLLYARAMAAERQGDLQTMERDLRAILADDPDNATALNALGYTLANRTDRHAEALQLIQRALELQPGEPAILDSMGWALYRLGRLDEALLYLMRAYAEFPDPEVAAHLGEVMWQLGDREGAKKVWRAAAISDPDHAVLRETLQRLGVADLGPGSAGAPAD